MPITHLSGFSYRLHPYIFYNYMTSLGDIASMDYLIRHGVTMIVLYGEVIVNASADNMYFPYTTITVL